jgi:hypothetical protein
MSHALQLRLAMAAQEEDLHDLQLQDRQELLPRNVAAVQRNAIVQKQEESRVRHRDSAPIAAAPSLAEQEQRRRQLQAEARRREVMMEEISSIHCSGTRDKNTLQRD